MGSPAEHRLAFMIYRGPAEKAPALPVGNYYGQVCPAGKVIRILECIEGGKNGKDKVRGDTRGA